MDYSRITEHLFVGTTPRRTEYDLLRRLGVGLVINMRVERRPHRDVYDPPMPVLWLPTFDSPLVPIPIRALVRGAQAAMLTLEAGGKVYAHCAGGVHRGVAMGCAILIAQGHSPEQAMELVKRGRAVADPYAWYIKRRILRFAEVWQEQGEEGPSLTTG